MKFVDKLLLAASGVGLVVMGADYVRNKNKPQQPTLMYCPGCRDYIQATQESFAVHYSQQHMWRQ